MCFHSTVRLMNSWLSWPIRRPITPAKLRMWWRSCSTVMGITTSIFVRRVTSAASSFSFNASWRLLWFSSSSSSSRSRGVRNGDRFVGSPESSGLIRIPLWIAVQSPITRAKLYVDIQLCRYWHASAPFELVRTVSSSSVGSDGTSPCSSMPASRMTFLWRSATFFQALIFGSSFSFWSLIDCSWVFTREADNLVMAVRAPPRFWAVVFVCGACIWPGTEEATWGPGGAEAEPKALAVVSVSQARQSASWRGPNVGAENTSSLCLRPHRDQRISS